MHICEQISVMKQQWIASVNDLKNSSNINLLLLQITIVPEQQCHFVRAHATVAAIVQYYAQMASVLLLRATKNANKAFKRFEHLQ